MSPAHCDKNPSDFQGRGTAFIATKPRPTSRVALRQKTVRLPGIRQLDIATSRPTSRDSTWEHRKNGHFLNCGEQTNDVRVVASHGVQGLEHWEDGGHVAMVSLHNQMSQQQPTSERTGTPPTSTEQDVVVEPALKLAADVDTMSLEAVQTELRSNDPGTATGAQTQEHLERRQRLWRRLDALTRSPAAKPSTPPAA
jgi:hypothetical protein